MSYPDHNPYQNVYIMGETQLFSDPDIFGKNVEKNILT